MFRPGQPYSFISMNGDVTSTSTLLGHGFCLNTWPRVGIRNTAFDGGTLIGRFAAGGDGWRFDDARNGEAQLGAGDPLVALQVTLTRLRVSEPRASAFGYLSYEQCLRCLGMDPRLSNHLDRFAVAPTQFLIFDSCAHPEPTAFPHSRRVDRAWTKERLDSLLQTDRVHSHVTKSRYLADVHRIREHIAAGDIYQANYTQAFDVHTEAGPHENFRSLSSRMPAPYSSFLSFAPVVIPQPSGSTIVYPAISLLSFSPERFWRKEGGIVESRPIKGTIAREHEGNDRLAGRRLLLSSKDRAELLMITDLVRNDLGQVAEIGTVTTDALARVRPAPSVWHLESTVRAKISDSKSWVDVMCALAPAGSISGTPKRRAVEILSGLEPAPRGPYCGAIGWIDANGNADFAVGIRTCTQIGNTIRIQGGGGIVADSKPEDEYYESLVKIAPLIESLTHSERPTIESGVNEAIPHHA